jgi:hypothetical protein
MSLDLAGKPRRLLTDMSKQTIGVILIFSPPVLLVVSLAIINYIEGWKRAVRKYKNFADNFDLICMTIATACAVMLFTGMYLILS